MKVFKATYPSERHFVDAYLTLINGLLKLTDMELKVLSEIVWDYYKLHNDGKRQPYISQHLFSPRSRQDMRQRLSVSKEMSPQSFNNHFMSLRNKGCFFANDETPLELDPRLLPEKEVSFKYKVNEPKEPTK